MPRYSLWIRSVILSPVHTMIRASSAPILESHRTVTAAKVGHQTLSHVYQVAQIQERTFSLTICTQKWWIT